MQLYCCTCLSALQDPSSLNLGFLTCCNDRSQLMLMLPLLLLSLPSLPPPSHPPFPPSHIPFPTMSPFISPHILICMERECTASKCVLVHRLHRLARAVKAPHCYGSMCNIGFLSVLLSWYLYHVQVCTSTSHHIPYPLHEGT